jgi:hypothetical protein
MSSTSRLPSRITSKRSHSCAWRGIVELGGMVKISAVGAVSSFGSPMTCIVAGVSLLSAMMPAMSFRCSG